VPLLHNYGGRYLRGISVCSKSIMHGSKMTITQRRRRERLVPVRGITCLHAGGAQRDMTQSRRDSRVPTNRNRLLFFFRASFTYTLICWSVCRLDGYCRYSRFACSGGICDQSKPEGYKAVEWVSEFRTHSIRIPAGSPAILTGFS
jgi:hypothetical protein